MSLARLLRVTYFFKPTGAVSISCPEWVVELKSIPTSVTSPNRLYTDSKPTDNFPFEVIPRLCALSSASKTYCTNHANDLEFRFDQSFCPSRERVGTSMTCRDANLKNKIYDEWALFYDEDMKALGYKGYAVVGKRIAELVPDKNAKILDLGCGTGRFGEELRSLGYSNIHGADANDNFLERSRKRAVYTELKKCRFGTSHIAPYEDGSFNTVAAVSVFGPGAVDHTALPEISRLVASGGYFVLFIRKSSLEMEEEIFNVKTVFEEWVASGQWERLSDISSVYFGGTDGVDKEDLAVERDGFIVTMRKLLR